jgi:hypothetical protein
MDSFHGSYYNDFNKNAKQQSLTFITNPSPRPSQCPSQLTYQHLIFSRKRFIMKNEVLSEALIVETTSKNRFNSIYVDFSQKKSDLLLIGTGWLSLLKHFKKNLPIKIHFFNLFKTMDKF